MEGTISFSKDELARKCDSTSFQYILSDSAPTKKNNTNGGAKEVKSKINEYREGLRDFQINMIPKLDRENAEEVYKEILQSHPTHLQAHLSFIQHLDPMDTKTMFPFAFKKSIELNHTSEKKERTTTTRENLQKVIELASIIIKETDKDALLAYYGLKSDSRSDANKIKM